MKKNILNSTLATLFVGAGVMFVNCATASEMRPLSSNVIVDDCAKELLLSYFPAPIVTDTLKKFDVPQDKWAGITKSLSEKDKAVVKMVETKAASMNPNPLKDPQQRQAAVKLFRDTLMEVFSGAMKDNGIEDTSKFQAMLDEIQQQKAKKFAMCMDSKKAQAKESLNSGTKLAPALKDKADTSDDSDDSDDDDEDNDDDDSDVDDASNKMKLEPAKKDQPAAPAKPAVPAEKSDLK